MKSIQSISLGYREGSSDKVYNASIDEVSHEAFSVNFSYGRRGGTLNFGTKTMTPVPMPQAVKIFTKIVSEKMGKGYTEIGGAAPRMVAPVTKIATPIAERVLPQLLNPVEAYELEDLFTDDSVVMQPKLDGKRILLHRDSQRVYATNRTGVECGIPESIVEQASRFIQESFILDGELVGDQYHVFDLLMVNGHNLRMHGYKGRLTELFNFVASTPSRPDHCFHIVPTSFTTKSKRDMFARCQQDNEEGVVFKRYDRTYSPGRPSSGGNQLKYKFVETASVRVMGHNPDKRSVRMGVLNEIQWTEVGNVTIGGAIPVPPVDSVIEVRYLYAYKGGSLFQPIYLGERDDIQVDECRLSQLKYKQEVE